MLHIRCSLVAMLVGVLAMLALVPSASAQTPVSGAPIRGACCWADGSCTIIRKARCTVRGGAFRGADTTCTPNVCPQPRGACCLIDGRCSVILQARCVQRGGTWKGPRTACGPTVCPITPGACCTADGSCLFVVPSTCRARAGTFQGMNTTCGVQTCPRPITPTTVVNGQPAGNPVPPTIPTGACCLPALTCIETTAQDCAARRGAFQGVGRACTSVYCPAASPPAACCLADASCVVATVMDCTARGGTYRGGACQTRTCVIIGACCASDGSCALTTQSECSGASTRFFGNYSTCTGADQCEFESGPCCLQDSSCVMVTQPNCAELRGRYQSGGGGQTCMQVYCPNPADVFACCASDGSCVATTQGDCLARRGQWQVRQACSPSSCSGLVVCCQPSGECWLTSQENCETYPESTFSFSASCTPAFCPRACRCDWNGDRYVNEGDLFAYVFAWFAQKGDYDADGDTDEADMISIIECILRRERGC